MSKLKAAKRKKLPKSEFGMPGVLVLSKIPLKADSDLTENLAKIFNPILIYS